MSYIGIQPEFYQMLVPGTPWTPAMNDDWKRAPWPTWGYNPNEIGPKKQGVGALGCGCSGVGAAAASPNPMFAQRLAAPSPIFAQRLVTDTAAAPVDPSAATAPPQQETGLARFATPLLLGALAIGAGGLFWYLRKRRS